MKAKYKRAITLHIAHGGILPCSEQKFQPFYYISFPLKVTSNNRRVPYADRWQQAKKPRRMKIFVDDSGTFEIRVPETWKYNLQNEKVHTFQEYEIWKPDAFQISIQKPDEDAIKRFELLTQNLESTDINGKRYFNLPESGDDGFTTKSWMSIIEGRIVLFTLTHSINHDKDLEDKTLEEKLEQVKEIISSFKIIEAEQRDSRLNSYRFEMFLQGVGATAYMLNKAIENHAFIEATCLLASQIDGLLRIGIVLQKQIENNNSVIEKEWIYQGKNDKKKSEKDIYKKAKEIGILDKDTFKELYRLYDDRNRVIHRFIISEITLAEVENIAYHYYQLQQKINSIIYNIESKQIETGIGMTKRGNHNTENYIDFIRGKIGKQNYFEKKKNE